MNLQLCSCCSAESFPSPMYCGCALDLIRGWLIVAPLLLAAGVVVILTFLLFLSFWLTLFRSCFNFLSFWESPTPLTLLNAKRFIPTFPLLSLSSDDVPFPLRLVDLMISLLLSPIVVRVVILDSFLLFGDIPRIDGDDVILLLLVVEVVVIIFVFVWYSLELDTADLGGYFRFVVLLLVVVWFIRFVSPPNEMGTHFCITHFRITTRECDGNVSTSFFFFSAVGGIVSGSNLVVSTSSKSLGQCNVIRTETNDFGWIVWFVVSSVLCLLLQHTPRATCCSNSNVRRSFFESRSIWFGAVLLVSMMDGCKNGSLVTIVASINNSISCCPRGGGHLVTLLLSLSFPFVGWYGNRRMTSPSNVIFFGIAVVLVELDIILLWVSGIT